jgi:pimeloyl-ACP methyl ester carboxylesterase
MRQDQNQTLSQRFQQYRASKAVLFWACAGSVVVATIVGFSWGGWVTGGTAQEMAEDSAAQARQQLAAVVCVDRFMAAPDAGVQLTALQEIERPYEQSKFVADGGWAIMVPASSPTDYKTRTDDSKAAGLCAAELAKREMPAPEKAELTNDDAAIAQ